jgi:tRNA threonylcarbamoyladenosine biosynthesis protein TsaE
VSLKKKKPSAIFNSASPTDTFHIAKKLAENLRGGEIIFLYGPIGSGKTTFIKGLAKALSIKTTPVSASFTLMRMYESKKAILAHIDLFRLKAGEIYNLGLEEILKNERAIIAIEWPGSVKNFFQNEKLEIKIKLLKADSRKFTFTAIGNKYRKLLNETKK